MYTPVHLRRTTSNNTSPCSRANAWPAASLPSIRAGVRGGLPSEAANQPVSGSACAHPSLWTGNPNPARTALVAWQASRSRWSMRSRFPRTDPRQSGSPWLRVPAPRHRPLRAGADRTRRAAPVHSGARHRTAPELDPTADGWVEFSLWLAGRLARRRPRRGRIRFVTRHSGEVRVRVRVSVGDRNEAMGLDDAISERKGCSEFSKSGPRSVTERGSPPAAGADAAPPIPQSVTVCTASQRPALGRQPPPGRVRRWRTDRSPSASSGSPARAPICACNGLS